MASLSMSFIAVESSELERIKKVLNLAADLVCDIKNDVSIANRVGYEDDYNDWTEYTALRDALLALGYEIK